MALDSLQLAEWAFVRLDTGGSHRPAWTLKELLRRAFDLSTVLNTIG